MVKDKKALFRAIPAVDRLMERNEIVEISNKYPRTLILKAIHHILEECRERIETDDIAVDPSTLKIESITRSVLKTLEKLAQPSLRPIINATGVVVHTNLGRSILGERVLNRFRSLAGGARLEALQRE